MRVLIDSNIIIYREDNYVILDNLQKLLKILNSIKDLVVLVHPMSLVDIKNDANEVRKNIISSKILTYPSLDQYPVPDSDNKFLDNFKIYKTNDKIDITILYAIYKDAVDFLITEDRGIHKKAKRVGLEERVLLIDEAIDFFEPFIHDEEPVSPPSLKQDLVYTLNSDDPIFNELKKDYPRFPEWLTRIKREGRKCWVHYQNDETIGALLIYKIEDDPIPSIPPLPNKKRFKICTLKVEYKGYKIGELFIKLSINYCIKNEIFELYLTHYTKKEDILVELISEYGFVKEATMPDGEDVYVKNLLPDRDVLDQLPSEKLDEKYYPIFYDGQNADKFLLPIYPRFHSRFFTDFLPRQLMLQESCGSFMVEGNAIKKAYISGSKIKGVKAGDIVLFYCIRPIQKLTSIGVIEAVYSGVKDSGQIMKLVGKRTVYSPKEIDEMKKPVLIILFRHHFHLKKPLTLETLKAAGILLSAPQSISKIAHENYMWIKDKGGIDGRFTID